jgi:hypothetical protein
MSMLEEMLEDMGENREKHRQDKIRRITLAIAAHCDAHQRDYWTYDAFQRRQIDAVRERLEITWAELGYRIEDESQNGSIRIVPLKRSTTRPRKRKVD